MLQEYLVFTFDFISFLLFFMLLCRCFGVFELFFQGQVLSVNNRILFAQDGVSFLDLV
jgi:hypothetical protein